MFWLLAAGCWRMEEGGEKREATSERREATRPSSPHDHQSLHETLRPLRGLGQRGSELVDAIAMREQRSRIQLAPRHRLDGGVDAGRVVAWVAPVRVDHRQPAPVPQLHVDLARAVLVV